MRIVSLTILLPISLYSQLAVSILDFSGEDVEQKVLKACYNQLEESLIESNRFTVIEKGMRDEILEEQKIQNSGICDTDCAVEIGQLIGAEFLMLGDVIGLTSRLFQVNIKIINVETGDVAEKVTNKIKGDIDDLLNGMEDASQEIVRRIATGSAPKVLTQQTGIQTSVQKSYGMVDIKSEPTGADILIDVVEYGITPKTLGKVETGARDLILNYPGYERLQKRIMVKEDETVYVSEYLVPKTGSLSILSEPPGATVFLDNIAQGQTPLNLFELNVKDYIVRLKLDDYQPIERRVTVQYSENTTQKFTLEPLPGKITLFTSPQSANILIGKKKYVSGSNGLATIKLPVGRYSMEISKKGYENLKRQVVIKPNDLETIDINLKKLPAGISSNPDMGFLTVNTLDEKTRLKIAGIKDVQRLPMQYFELRYGMYNLKAFGTGLESKKEKVLIEKQKTTNIDINLVKKKKSKSVRYSLIFPGGGQFYEGSKRGVVYSGIFIGTGYLLVNTLSSLSENRDLLDKYRLDYQNAIASADIDEAWSLYEKQAIKVNDTQDNLMIIGTTLASAWISSIIDSYFFSKLK